MILIFILLICFIHNFNLEERIFFWNGHLKLECALRVNFGICISVDCAVDLKYNYTLYLYIKLNQIIYQIQIVYQFVNHS